jgi:hypothetical protein
MRTSLRDNRSVPKEMAANCYSPKKHGKDGDSFVWTELSSMTMRDKYAFLGIRPRNGFCQPNIITKEASEW